VERAGSLDRGQPRGSAKWRKAAAIEKNTAQSSRSAGKGIKWKFLELLYSPEKVTQFRRGRDCAQARYENEH